MKRLTIYDKNNPPSPSPSSSIPSKSIQVSSDSSKSTPHVIIEANDSKMPHVLSTSIPQVEIMSPKFDSEGKHHRYMHIKQQEKCAILNAQLDAYAEAVGKCLGMSIDDFGNPSLPTPSTITVVGRIVSGDSSAKLKDDGIYLECSRQMGSGCRVLLEFDQSTVSKKESFCFFPGALVVLQGISNPNRLSFQPSKQLFPQIQPPSPCCIASAPFKMIIAAGPFTLHNSTAFTTPQDMVPFEKLLNFVNEQRPQILFLMGPFIDAEHPALSQGIMTEPLTPEELFLKEFSRRIALLTSRHPHLRVFLIPSQRDLLADPILPHPPSLSMGIDLPNIGVLSNPVNLTINNIPISILNSDILLSLGMEELVMSEGGVNGDRFSRLSNYLYEQGSLWPLHPSPPHTNIDYTRLDKLGMMQTTPSLLITSSQLKCFVRTLPSHSSTVLNPGLFCRPAALGTAAVVSFESDQRRIDLIQF